MTLQGQLSEMQTHLEGLEKERDFYFAKVCDMSSLVAFTVLIVCKAA